MTARAAGLLGDRDVERETRSSIVRFVIPKIEEDSTIEAAESLVPLHNAPALAGIERHARNFPHLPHVAVFETAFHATLPAEAAVYAVPRQWRSIVACGLLAAETEWAVG